MNYSRVAEIVQRAVEELVQVGASRELLETHIGPLEVAAINSIAENSKRQLLLDLSIKTADLAERWGVTSRTVRNWRRAEIERKFVSATSSA